MGVSVENAAKALEEAGATVIGSNCGNGIENMIKIAGALAGVQRPVYYKILPDAVSNLTVGITSNTSHIWDSILVTLRGN